MPAYLVVHLWRRWVREIFLEWKKDTDQAYSRQCWLREQGQGLRLAAAWERTGRTERTQTRWCYLTQRVLREFAMFGGTCSSSRAKKGA